jgi:hypothetical protein
MAVYFLRLEAELFHGQIAPALAASWRRRSFVPCLSVCRHLQPAAREFTERYRIGPEEPLLSRAVELPFERDLWRALAGEFFLYGAADMPTMQTAAVTLCCLLAPERLGQCGSGREQFAAIEQAHYGCRDLVFGGGFYRPEQAGWNDTADVARMAGYLTAVDPEAWTTEPLRHLPDLADETERAEELEFARECWQNLCAVYAGAARAGQVIVCELL